MEQADSIILSLALNWMKSGAERCSCLRYSELTLHKTPWEMIFTMSNLMRVNQGTW